MNTPRLAHFIAGKPVVSTTTDWSPVYDPSRGELAARAPIAGDVECARAIEAAEAAFGGWAATPPLRRARVISRFKSLVEQHADDLARLISREHGKILSDAHGEIARGLEVVDFACGIAQLLKGEYLEEVSRGVDAYSVRQPLGVCVGITPCNFPAMVPLWMFPVAIACGNTFILKPSERVPSTAMYLAELFASAELPAGVLNVLHGDARTARKLVADPGVQAVSFVGSTAAAHNVYVGAASAGKRVQALGGAKNHLIVLPDADVNGAVDALIGAAFGSAGERCMAISVAVLVGDGADSIVARLAERVRSIRVGAPEDPASQMGPLITAAHRDRVRAYIASGVEEGATLLADGRDCEAANGPKGFFLGASLFDHVTPAMRIYREEIFGPVLCVIRVPTLLQAIKLVNDHEYGNGAALFTRDGAAARQFVRQAQVGMVGINVPIPVPMAFHSFGGWKRSLFGDTHIYGPEGVRFYTRAKAVSQRWPDSHRTGASFVMPANAEPGRT